MPDQHHDTAPTTSAAAPPAAADFPTGAMPGRVGATAEGTRTIELHEQQLRTGVTTIPVKRTVVRTRVVTEEVTVTVTRSRHVLEVVDLQHPQGPQELQDLQGSPPVSASAGSGTPPSVAGSRVVATMTLYEQQPVVTLRNVPVEQVQLTVRTVTGEQAVQASLGREEIDLQTSGGLHTST